MKKSQGEITSSSLPLSCFVYAAGHEEEGICLLLHIGTYRILLDCGLADLSIISEQPEPPADLVFCSHAHEDHCRGLLQLHQAFPQLPIYTSEVTAKLLGFYWLPDTTTLDWCQTIPWRSPLNITSDLAIELIPSGHLPGAASIVITYTTKERNYKVMYTGDFSVSNFQLVEGMSIENLRGLAPDVLIVEGTYGTVRHPHRRLQEKQLMERIHDSLDRGKNVLLPVPPIGLGQEILKLLRSHHQFTGRDLDIWVDRSIARTCDIYLELLSQFPLSVQNFAKHQSLFWDERICPRMRRLGDRDMAIDNKSGVFIVDYMSDLWQYVQQDSTQWLVLLAEHPQQFLRPDFAQLDLLHSRSSVTIESYLLAEHSDGRNTTQLIHNLRPQHIILAHGTLNYLLELASLEELRNRYQIHSPAGGILVELPIGDRFVQPKVDQPVYYEGELNENEVGAISIVLPDNISNDSRWKNLADTGIIQARWQGDELIVKGVSQRELLNSNNRSRISSDLDCCDRCIHYHNQQCWNHFSPLYGFKVIPEGYCPVFEAEDESD